MRGRAVLELTWGRPLRVALALAKPIERHGLQSALAVASDIEVVAQVAEAQAAVAVVAACQPDVVVWDCELDVNLGDSLATIERLSQRTAVLAFGPLDDERVVQMVAAGVSGYLYDGDNLARVREAVRACGRGHAWYSPAVVPFLSQGRPGWPRHEWPQVASPPGDDYVLTDRQWEVLSLAAAGQSNKEIAHQLGVQRPTIEEHLSRVYAKLGVSGRAGAVRWYVEHERGRRGSA